MSKQKTASTAVKGAVIEASAEFDAVAYNPNAETCVNARFDGETVWLTQNEIAKLFGKSRRTIAEHLAHAMSEELAGVSVWRNFRHTAIDGKTYCTKFYNLDAILSVGYRVKSPRGVEFRRWANGVLCERLTGRPAAPAPAVHAPAPARPSLPWNPNVSDAQNYAARYFDLERQVDRLRRDVEQGLAMLEKRVESHENALNIILKVNDFDRDLLKTFARYNWELKRSYRNSREER